MILEGIGNKSDTGILLLFLLRIMYKKKHTEYVIVYFFPFYLRLINSENNFKIFTSNVIRQNQSFRCRNRTKTLTT